MDKVDRALEIQVIDWLQWAEFPESLDKRSNNSDMAQLTLELIGKRKKAVTDRDEIISMLEGALKDIEFGPRSISEYPMNEMQELAQSALNKLTKWRNKK